MTENHNDTKPSWKIDALVFAIALIIWLSLSAYATYPIYESTSGMDSLSISATEGILMNKTSIHFEVDPVDQLVITISSELEIKNQNPILSFQIQHDETVIRNYVSDATIATNFIFYDYEGGRNYYFGLYQSRLSFQSVLNERSIYYSANLTNVISTVYQKLLLENGSLMVEDVGVISNLHLTIVLDNVLGGQARERLLAFALTLNADISGNLSITIPSDDESLTAQWNSIDMFPPELFMVRMSFQSTHGLNNPNNVYAYWKTSSVRDSQFFSDVIQPLQGATLGGLLFLILNNAARYHGVLSRYAKKPFQRFSET